MSNIKKLKEFQINEDFNFGGFFSNLFSVMGTGFKDTIRTKITAALLEKLGLMEGSLLSSFVQNFVTEIPMGDIPKILSGDNLNSTYWAPKLADSLRRFVEQKGIDTVAASMGIKTTGLAFTFLRNMLLSKEGQDKMVKAFEELLGSAHIGKEAVENLSSNDKEKLTNALSQRLGQSYTSSQVSPSTGASRGDSGSSDGIWGALQRIWNSAAAA